MSYSAAVGPQLTTELLNPASVGLTLSKLTQKSLFWSHSWPWETVYTHPSIFSLHFLWFRASQSITSPEWCKAFQSRFKLFNVLQVIRANARSSQQSLLSSHMSNLWAGIFQKKIVSFSASSRHLIKHLANHKCPHYQHWANPYFKSKRLRPTSWKNV